MVDLNDNTQFQQLMDQEESEVNIDGHMIKTIPLNYPEDVITYMLLPSKAQLVINNKIRIGEQLPALIYVKRRKGRPARDTGSNNEYHTPVYKSGQVDPEVMQFFA